MKKHNFNAGPSILPREVIEDTAKAILDFNGSGLSLMEISHRAKDFQPVVDEAEALFKELLNIPEGYSVMFLGGGASMEFCMVPYNFLEKKAAYLNTGVWAKKAMKVVSAALYNDWCDYHVTCRPTQYNDIVRRAEYVITGTFHGNVFAIQNRKRFITIPLSEKVRDLICNFGLQDRILELDDLSGETMEAILEHQNMDYEKIGKKIQKMRQSSLEFLKNALENYDSSDM